VIDFGQRDPRDMPAHLFPGVRRMDYATAIPGNPDLQNCSICPRYWFVDATFACARCSRDFTFTAAEQRVWYEEYGFWVDSIPRHCLPCRRELRHLKALRQEYDEHVSHVLEHGDLERKRRLASVIDQLYELDQALPPRINEHRRRLANQLARHVGNDRATTDPR
jgi:hypothetical protein